MSSSFPQLLSVAQAAQCLRQGQVIAYPTEAVYGLGCDPADHQAVQHILGLKQRSPEAGLILIADSFARFRPYVDEVAPEALETAMASWPGAVTWLFPRSEQVPDWLAGKHPGIAVRVTNHPVCRALCAAFDGPIVSTSANPSGAPPAKTAEQVHQYFASSLAGIVAGELGGRDQPSEIRALQTGHVIRAG